MRCVLLSGVCFVLLISSSVSAVESEKTISPSMHQELEARLAYDAFRHTLAKAGSLPARYGQFKKDLEDKTGLSYSLTSSLLLQRGEPHTDGRVWQSHYDLSVNWDLIQSDKYGALSAQLSYALGQNWDKNGKDVSNRMRVVTPINDHPENGRAFEQLSLKYQLPADLDWLSISLGQFHMDDFDGTAYNSNQQINFLNYALSENASSTYSNGSLGGYLEIKPNSKLTATVGFQNAYNISGKTLSAKNFGKKKYTSFASIAYTPVIPRWGRGEYNVLVYYQPSIPSQPYNTVGWSINLMQNFDKFGVFASVNGTGESGEKIKQSYVLGGVYNNPLNRNALDQIGVALAVNRLNKNQNEPKIRSIESVLEAYWAWGISNFLTITPDIQLYINPGANRQDHTATVASLRATVMF